MNLGKSHNDLQHRRAAVCPPPPASRNPGTPATRTALPSLSLGTSGHAGVAIRLPRKPQACAPHQGRNASLRTEPKDLMHPPPYLSSARRSRRISCTGVPCRNPSARDPSPLAQDNKSGGGCLITRTGWGAWWVRMELQGRFASARRGHTPALHCASQFALRCTGGAGLSASVGRRR